MFCINKLQSEPSLTSIQYLLTAFAYLAGIGFAFRAIFQLKQYGEARTMMSSNANMKGPLILLFTAGALIYLPSMLGVILQTFFAYGTDEIPAITSDGSDWSLFMQNMAYFLQVVGLIAFIRGWFLLASTSGQASPGTTGKAITHIIGGVLLVNIMGVMTVLENTFFTAQSGQ